MNKYFFQNNSYMFNLLHEILDSEPVSWHSLASELTLVHLSTRYACEEGTLYCAVVTVHCAVVKVYCAVVTLYCAVVTLYWAVVTLYSRNTLNVGRCDKPVVDLRAFALKLVDAQVV